MDFSENVSIALDYLFPFLLVLIVAEFFTARYAYNIKESKSSFIMGIIAAVIATQTKAYALLVFIFIFEVFKSLRMEFLGYESLGWGWQVWVISMICDDFNFYWHHRFSHGIRLLWAAHSPHHNADTFNLTVSIRNGWFITFYKPIFWLWMPAIGFEPTMVATCLILNATYQFFLHSQLVPSLGWYEKLFNTPYVHCVHHSSNVEYLDKNHGGILLIWDKLFGTYQDPIKGVKAKYGVTHPLEKHDAFYANFHEFATLWKDMKNAESFGQALQYAFNPPGWSPNKAESQTAKELQAQLKEKQQPKAQAVA